MAQFQFTCIIKRDQEEEPPFTVKGLDDDFLLKEFQAWIRSRYDIQGKVTLYHNQKKLTDLFASLGEILGPDDTLVVHSDSNATVAAGGIGMGGSSRATGGGFAVGQGGFGDGGKFTVDGGAFGGRGIGGGAKGDEGEAGQAFGGNASNLNGKSKAGRGVGGEFEANQGKKLGFFGY